MLKLLILDCHYLNEPESVSTQLASRQAGTCIFSHRPGSAAWDVVAGERYSPLTKYLIQGLGLDGAKPDAKGRVTVDRWFDYVQQQMMEHASTEPMRWDVGAEGRWVIVPTVEREGLFTVAPSGYYQRTFRDLSRMFRDGLVIPFLGAGAIPDIHLDDVEEAEQEPPLERALAYKLAELAQRELTDVPEHLEAYPLAMIAQYYQTFIFGGRPSFYNELKRCFPRSAPGPMHRLLVQQERPLLVITSSYDTTLEQVFDEQKKPYAVVTHISHALDPTNLGKVLVRYSERPDEPEIWLSDELSIDLERCWVFYKIQGAFKLFLQGLIGRELDSLKFF